MGSTQASRTNGKPHRAVRDSDYRQLADFRHAIRIFLEFSEHAARDAGVTPQQHQALLAIRGMNAPEGVNLGALAERLRIRHHSAVELVNRLVAAGLVVRDEDPQDLRRVLVALTTRSKGILQSLSAIHLEELRRLKPVLSSVLALADEDS